MPEDVGASPMRGSARPPAARPDTPEDRAGGIESAGRGAHASPAAGPLTGYQVDGEDGTYVISRQDGRTVGAFYAESDPGWWRGAVNGRVKRVFVPGAEPLDVAARFLRN